jgi:hypothetical protein
VIFFAENFRIVSVIELTGILFVGLDFVVELFVSTVF